jgi:DNA polymerase-3 subunit delta'
MTYPWLREHWMFFLKRLQQGRLAHALMIQGPAGCGKNALAVEMVARLLCCEDQPEACGQCRSCKLLAGGAHPDRFELFPEEGSEVIKVDQVRSLIASLDLTTSISARKVAYIHPAESMNIAAANALLKSLEEPTGNAVIILVSSDPGSLPVTIRSRCQSIVVNQPDSKLVGNWLTKATGRSAVEVSAALQAAGGSPLRAARYLESPELDTFVQVTEGLATLLKRPGSVSLVTSKLGEFNPDDLWRWLSLCTGEAVKCRMSGRASDWLPADVNLSEHTLLSLQKQADINRRLAKTPVRGDLLLQDWLIRWAEQNVRNTQ